MRKEKRKTMFRILLLLMFGIGIGYAALTTNLSINGSATMTASSWDVHIENLVLNPKNVELSTGDSAATINSTTRTSISYSITLQKPGDFYEFTFDIKNAGTIDAMIGSISSKINGNPITTLPAYLEYRISYSDDQELLENQLLTAGDKETMKVYIGYKKDLDPEDLPETNQTNSFLIEIEYLQADENAIQKLNYYYHVSGNLVSLGDYVPTLGDDYWFSDYEEAMNKIGLPIFVRVGAKKNGEIAKASLGFIYENQLYYIDGGPDYSYEEAKEFLKGVYGISNCSETTYSGYTEWKCGNINFSMKVRTNGYIGGTNKSGGGCSISADGGQGCGN